MKPKELIPIDIDRGLKTQLWVCKNKKCLHSIKLTKRENFFRYPITCAKCSEITDEYIKNWKMTYYEVRE